MLHLNCNKEYEVAISSRIGYEQINLRQSKMSNFKVLSQVLSHCSLTINMVLSNPWVALANVLQISFTQCDTTILIRRHMWRHTKEVMYQNLLRTMPRQKF